LLFPIVNRLSKDIFKKYQRKAFQRLIFVLKLKLVGESPRFQWLNGTPSSKRFGESVDTGFSLASLETRKGHVVHISYDHDGEFNGGKGAVTPFHHVLVEYHDRFDHVFCVVNRGQLEEVANA